jgi:archaeal type IV pilus assembly protein PilA
MIKELKRKLSAPFNGEADRGVSPVIGVILMVAITVILAAVIGAFVLGLGDGLNQDVQAGVSVEQVNETEFQVTWTSQGTAEEIHFGSVDDTADLNTVGESATITVESDDSTSIITVGEDGTETAIRTISN